MTRVIIVEDNEMSRDMLSKRLGRRGYEISIAIDGREGIEKTREEHPDLVLMDMNLPDVDGWEATKQLKADLETRNIPIIALTAHAMNGDREKSLNAGCDDYDSKPLNLSRLLHKMEKLLQRASP